MGDWFWICLSLGFFIALLFLISEHQEGFVRVMDNEMTVALILVTMISLACLAMSGQL